MTEFYEKKEDFLRVMKGDFSNMFYVLRVGSQYPLANTHLTFGNLRQIGTQLIADVAPAIGSNLYVQIRQKTDQDDSVAVNVIVPCANGKNEHQQLSDWHYQPKNKDNFYYTEFNIDSTSVQLAIGSGVIIPDLLKYFEQKTKWD